MISALEHAYTCVYLWDGAKAYFPKYVDQRAQSGSRENGSHEKHEQLTNNNPEQQIETFSQQASSNTPSSSLGTQWHNVNKSQQRGKVIIINNKTSGLT